MPVTTVPWGTPYFSPPKSKRILKGNYKKTSSKIFGSFSLTYKI
jgi:hypothetical protein